MQQPVNYFIDETKLSSDSDVYLALTAIKTTDEYELRERIEEIRKSLISRIELHEFSSMDNHWIPHYCDDAIDIRREFIREITKLPFEAYIEFIQLPNEKEFYKYYDTLFLSLIKFRIQADKDLIQSITFEKNHSKTNQRKNELKSKLEKMINSLNMKNKQRHPDITSGNKDELLLSLSDYIGGIAMNHLTNKKTEKAKIYERDYNQIREKVRRIHDLNKNKFYTASNPFYKLDSDIT